MRLRQLDAPVVCRATAPVAKLGSRSVCPTIAKSTKHLATAIAVSRRQQGSENIKSAHQLLARFHYLLWIHPAKHFFPTFPIHCCEFAHELVARFPFRVFGRANAEREQSGQDPNRNVCRSDQKHVGNLQITILLCKDTTDCHTWS